MYSNHQNIKEVIDVNVIEDLTANNQGVSDLAKVTHAIQSADSIIDGYIRIRYHVPLDPVPELITKLSTDLTVLALYKLKAAHFDIPQWAVDEANRAHKLLAKMWDGKLDLGIEPPPRVSTAGVAQYSGPNRQFTEEKLKYF